MNKTNSVYNEFIEGIRIFQKYGPSEAGLNEGFGAEHEIIYVGTEPSVVSDEDKQRLDALGFHECSEFECWGFFT